jgi:hypothetical protein
LSEKRTSKLSEFKGSPEGRIVFKEEAEEE